MPYVKTVAYHEAQGGLKNTYDRILKSRGTISNVTAVSSLRPHLVKTLFEHNASVMGTQSGLTPAERQMIATVVSSINRCQY